jgi:GTP-binding protein HflX
VLVEDKLFATLDPTVRQIRLPGAGKVLLSDTVGFIHKLPTLLVAAFRATLEELDDADVLVHVVDVSHPNRIEQTVTVDSILDELGLEDRPRILVLNKADALPGGTAPSNPAVQDALRELRSDDSAGRYVVTAAQTGFGLQELLAAIESVLAAQRREIDVLVPYDRGDLLHVLHERGAVDREEHLADGVRVRARVPGALAGAVRDLTYRRARRTNGKHG